MIPVLFIVAGSLGLFATFTAPIMPLRIIGITAAVFATVGFWASIIGV